MCDFGPPSVFGWGQSWRIVPGANLFEWPEKPEADRQKRPRRKRADKIFSVARFQNRTSRFRGPTSRVHSSTRTIYSPRSLPLHKHRGERNLFFPRPLRKKKVAPSQETGIRVRDARNRHFEWP